MRCQSAFTCARVIHTHACNSFTQLSPPLCSLASHPMRGQHASHSYGGQREKKTQSVGIDKIVHLKEGWFPVSAPNRAFRCVSSFLLSRKRWQVERKRNEIMGTILFFSPVKKKKVLPITCPASVPNAIPYPNMYHATRLTVASLIFLSKIARVDVALIAPTCSNKGRGETFVRPFSAEELSFNTTLQF